MGSADAVAGSGAARPAIVIGIDRIAAGGAGVGRLDDGRVAFVPRTAPGDQVEIAVASEHARFVRARLLAVRVPSPDRIEPPCPHYLADDCGGCQLQHLAPAAQHAARRAVLGDALRRIARLPLDDPPLVAGPEDWGYRARMTLSRGPNGRIGFHRQSRPNTVFELDRCAIAREPLNRVWRAARAHRRLLPPGLERLTLRLDRSGGTHLVAETAPDDAWTGGADLARVLDRDGQPATVWWKPAGGAARALAGHPTAYPATAFEQVNPAMGDRIRRDAVRGLGSLEGRLVWDLYAGLGETSDLLARGGARVESVEADRRAVQAALRRQAEAGWAVRRHAGRVEDLVEGLPPADLAILNPPRAGLAPLLVATLIARPPERVAYVSCDPATLARDLARLAGQGPFAIAGVRAYDLFPQTAHVEAVAMLERR